MKIYKLLLPTLGVVFLASCNTSDNASAQDTPEVLSERVQKLPKKIFAHYMGSNPVASGAQEFHRSHDWKQFRHDSSDPVKRHGGHLRNWDLVPYGTKLTPEQSADLEIRRALRIGIDGFAIDAWAGGKDAKRSLDALLKVAKEKNYPFEITICLDPVTLTALKETPAQAIKYLLDNHGDNPKLARREGKPLIFGYQSIWMGLNHATSKMRNHPELEGKTGTANSPIIRATPEGWDAIGEGYRKLEEQVGQPLYLHFCLAAFDYGIPRGGWKPAMLPEAAGVLANHVDAIGSFTWLGPQTNNIARTVVENGAEWGFVTTVGQKENVPWESNTAPGFNWMFWPAGAIATQSTLIQFITWNDYGENSMLAPAYNTRYGLYDLHGHMIKWWKQGKEPTPQRDKIYVGYHKYPEGAKVFPFLTRFKRGRKIEVLTMLTQPAKIRLAGRNAEYDAPAGLHRQQFDNTPGEVIVEVLRNGKVVQRLESAEPITDKPFREDNGLVVISNVDKEYWKEDFGDVPLLEYSEYGDEDQDGLPNWFEMYWFGKWLDFSTQTTADPNADPDGDGQTNLQEYSEQTDPTKA